MEQPSTTRTSKRAWSVKGTWRNLRTAAREFIVSDPLSAAATIAYYTIFSMPAVLILVVMAAAAFYDEAAVRQALLGQAAHLTGRSSADQLGAMLAHARVTETRFLAKLIGLVALMVSAGTVFASLQNTLNRIWQVEPQPGRAVWHYLLTRLTSLALVASFGFLMLVSLVMDAALLAVLGRFEAGLTGVAATVVAVAESAISFGMITLVFALLFKFLPDVRLRLRDVLTGALLTALLFTLGKSLIGLYISYSDVGDAYGAAGAVVIILVWVYYSTVIMLFGAHYTHVSTRSAGTVRPVKHAANSSAEGS